MPAGRDAESMKRTKGGIGLSSKLLVLTVIFVMIAEVFIFVPSIANFRNNWLANRLATARVASLVITNSDEVPMSLEDSLVRLTGALALSIQNDDRRRMIFQVDGLAPPDYEIHIGHMMPWDAIMQSFETLFAGDRIMRIIDMPIEGGPSLELIMPERDLRDAMVAFGRNILILSLIISAITAALVYLSLRWLFVRPMVRLTRNMEDFSAEPEDARRIIEPSERRDEIGQAENRLQDMQHQLARTLTQQRRLADLGLAVSKINHDLRNILASAQLFTDRLGELPDPTVQKLAPKLIASLDRAVGYTRSVLSYSRPQERPPERTTLEFCRLVGDVGELLGLGPEGPIAFENRVPPDTLVDADPEQLFRVILNLCRNAAQALEQASDCADKRIIVGCEQVPGHVLILVSDTGPGVPEPAREGLFKAFQGSMRPGGTGLGLAIAAELVRAHGGTITLLDQAPGAHFRIDLPALDSLPLQPGEPIGDDPARHQETV